MYSEILMPHISKCEFSQPCGIMGVDVTQKRKVVLIWNLAQIKDILYRIMKPPFWILLPNLDYSAKLPDWSIICCHGDH